MYSEEIKYLSYYSDDSTHDNDLRNNCFEGRSCLINVLDFLDQEVVIIPRKYFSYAGGLEDIMHGRYFYDGYEEDKCIERWNAIDNPPEKIEYENGYHLSILYNYITIVANNRRCIFTNKVMGNGNIIRVVIWVKNLPNIEEI
jgi:hypothetical protein